MSKNKHDDGVFEHIEHEINERHLSNLSHVIGKEAHDDWVDARTRNLSIDVVNGLIDRPNHSSVFAEYLLPLGLGIAMIVIMLIKPMSPTTTQSPVSGSDSEYVYQSELNATLMSSISNDEAIDMIARDVKADPVILTDHDVDEFIKGL